MIHTENLTRSFKHVVAVHDLNLHIKSGEVFGFLGPNGAGKTTTVRMLAGLIPPSSGRAEVVGFSVGRDNHKIRHHVGVLTETPGLYEKLSAYLNLEFYAKLFEVENRDQQIEKHLTTLGLWDRRKDPVGTFSKGMRQKVAIARALLHDPQILFLDEPTSGLDPESARTVRDAIAELAQGEGRTIFLCTHNLHEAEGLCDQIGMMKQTLIKVGVPRELKQELFEAQTVVEFNHMPADVDKLLDFPFVRQFRIDPSSLTMTLEDPALQNSQVISRLVEHGAEIRYVRPEEKSLEDVYLALVGEDATS